MSYYEELAHKMNSIKIDRTCHNVVFVENNEYEVKTFPLMEDGGKWSFDQLVDTMESFNSKVNGKRALYVTTPNRFGEGMLTYCAPMKNEIPKNCGVHGKGRLSDEYLVPDIRQVAADYVVENPSSLDVISEAIQAS